MSEAKVDEISHCTFAAQRSAGATHTGYRRSQNEDALWGDETQGVWVIADGLGGHQAGDIASQTVIEEIQRSAATDHHYQRALQCAHSLLLGDEHNTAAMGSTAVVATEDGLYFHVYWVGDSRAYLWAPGPDNGLLKQLTVDHSYVQTLLDSGTINSVEAANHPSRHVITRCIGGSSNPTLEIDRVSSPWQKGQKLLLCTDGLSNEVSAAQICQILAENSDNRRATDLLIEAALYVGGRDNITALLISSPDQKPSLAQNQQSRPANKPVPALEAPPKSGKLTKKLGALALLCGLAVFALWQLSQLG